MVWTPAIRACMIRILHIRRLIVDNVVDIICNTLKLDQFRTTPASLKALYNLALAARVKAGMVKGFPNCEVSSHDGAARIHIPTSESTGRCDDQSLIFFHPIQVGRPSLSLNCSSSLPSLILVAIIMGVSSTVIIEPVNVTLVPDIRTFRWPS